ncbi:MAG: phosphotransferase [Chloroflexi bacterium]|nr:phosphotransferase [Chloroflexota bacterium]
MTNNKTKLWEEPNWHDEVHAWIHAVLKREGITLTGNIGQEHVRQWSNVLTVPTNEGTLYFKAAEPALHHEAALTDALARWEANFVPALLDVDTEKSWFLMRSSGTPLRTFIKAEKSLHRWKAILEDFVAFQKRLASRTDELILLGAFDRRLVKLPALFEELIVKEDEMLLDEDESLTSDEYARLKKCAHLFQEMCAELSSFNIPESLHHDDFHDANVFIQNDKPIFTDWGESAVTHPFFTLIVLLRGAENSLGLDENAPEIKELTSYYLENWQDFASPKDLTRAGELALKVGLVNRALTWQHVIAHMDDAGKADYAVAVPSYLKDFLSAIENDK